MALRPKQVVMVSALERSVLLRALVRYRWPILLIASVAAALIETHTTGPSSDGPYFTYEGERLLSSAGLHVYAARGLQAGPWQVGGFGLLAKLTGLLHLPDDATYAVISTVISTVVIVGGVRLLRRASGLGESGLAELLTGAFAVGWLISTETYTSGHPAELVIPIAWIAAAVLARDGRVALAGLVIGVGAGFETWAVLGVPVLLLSATWRGTAKAVAVTAGMAVATYLPFVIAGPFRMGKAVWPVSSDSFVHVIDPGLASYPWSARMLQSVIVLGLGITAWWLGRQRLQAELVWLLPAVIALAKAISEPSGYDWYWLPIQLALLAACACLDRLPRRVGATVVLAEIIVITTSLQVWPLTLAALLGLLSVAAPLPSGVGNRRVRRQDLRGVRTVS